MPSFYLARTNNGPVLPSFKQKGIPDCMPGPVGETSVFVSSSFNGLPRNIFKYHALSIANNAPVSTDEDVSQNLFKPITTLSHPFDMPVSSFRFNELNNDQRAELQGMGMQQDLANKNIYIGSPSVNNLSRITQLGPVEDRLRPGHISYEGYFAWVYLMKGVQIYSTVKNAMGPIPFYNTFIADQTIAPLQEGKVLCMDGIERPFKSTMSHMSLAPNTNIHVVFPPSKGLSSFSGSFLDVKVDTGSDDKSIFFPYFRGMLLADKETSFEVFKTLFKDLLGPTPESNIRLMGRVRSGARQIAFSQSGIVLSHIYRCISIAEEVPGSRITIILNGNTYAGCVIQGEFKLHAKGTTVEAGDITGDLLKVNLLESQAQEICDLINAVENANNEKPYSFTKETFMSSRSALRTYNSLDRALFHSSSILETVKTKLEEMEYNDIFPPPTMSMLMDAVKFMSSGEVSILRNYPAYLGGGVLASPTRTWEALSMFGPKAPTCNTGDPKGIIITFPNPGKEDKNTVPVNGVRPLAYFPFWMQPLNIAVAQWDKMIHSGVLSIPRGRKNKKEFTDLHRTIFTIGASPQFQTLYDTIKGMVAEARLSGVSTGKRKRGSKDVAGREGRLTQKFGDDADLL